MMLQSVRPGMVVDWIRRDLGHQVERLAVRVERVRCARVEVSHELGFAWVAPHELAPSLTASAGCASTEPTEAYPLSG